VHRFVFLTSQILARGPVVEETLASLTAQQTSLQCHSSFVCWGGKPTVRRFVF